MTPEERRRFYKRRELQSHSEICGCFDTEHAAHWPVEQECGCTVSPDCHVHNPQSGGGKLE